MLNFFYLLIKFFSSAPRSVPSGCDCISRPPGETAHSHAIDPEGLSGGIWSEIKRSLLSPRAGECKTWKKRTVFATICLRGSADFRPGLWRPRGRQMTSLVGAEGFSFLLFFSHIHCLEVERAKKKEEGRLIVAIRLLPLGVESS